MSVKRVVLGVLAVLIVAIAGTAIYFYQLTAPVPVSQTAPLAPTLAVPAPAQGQAGAPAGTPGPGMPGFPPNGTPGGGMPGFPFNGTPGAGMPGFPPGGGPPGGGPGMGGDMPISAAVPAAPTFAAPAAGASQLYRIDAKQSEAAYSASETFLQAFAGMQPGKVTTVGKTTAVAGDILVDNTNPSASQLGEIVIDISQFTSDIGMRDNAIRRQWLESAKYPLATFQNAKLSGLSATWPQGQPVAFQITGDLTVHGTTQPATWASTVTLDGKTLTAQASTSLKMSQFGVQAPSMPMLTVEDPVTITLNLVAPAVGTTP
jgi:polyisoprenoid-binding protein YceI